MKIGIFGGQGTEYQNMGMDFIEKFPLARDIFTKTEKILSDYFSLKNILQDSGSKIHETQYAQPLIVMFNYIISSCLEKYDNIVFNEVFGLSLGEYSSLINAQVIKYEECLRLVAIRGRLMQDACEEQPSVLAAILINEISAIDSLINQGFRTKIFKANFNSNNQIVVGGSTKDIDDFLIFLKAQKIRGIKLKVSGAFHTVFMKSAEQKFIQYLKNVEWKKPIKRVLSNLTGNYYNSDFSYSDVLSKQITHPVLLTKIISKICDSKNEYYEIGPKKIISKLLVANCKSSEKYTTYIGTVKDIGERNG